MLISSSTTLAKPPSDTSSLITKTYLVNSLSDDYVISSKDIRNMVVFVRLVYLSSTLAMTHNVNSNCIRAIPVETTEGGRLRASVQTMQAPKVY